MGFRAARAGRGATIVGLAALALAGCASKTVCPPTGKLATVAPPPDWRAVVTDPDHDKLRQLRTRFLDGLTQARGKGFGAQLDAEGRLFNPDFAQDGAMPKPGSYHCRTFTLGPPTADRPAFVADPVRGCTLEADGQIEQFVEQDGLQRLTGRVFPDEPARAVFLGTRILPDEATALHYGRDDDRDTVAALQRIGDARWRMAVPSPAWGSSIQVIELTPAG